MNTTQPLTSVAHRFGKVKITMKLLIVQVFLLDYGTTHLVELRHIYKWTPKCDKMAFCAILFTLANVQCPDPYEPSVVEYATEKIPKTFTTAEMM